MNVLKKIGRWIFTVPAIFICFYFLGLGVDKFIFWLAGLEMLWFILAVIFIGWTIVVTISSIGGLLFLPVLWLAPSEKAAGIIIGMLAFVGAVGSLVVYWGIEVNLIRKIIIELAVVLIYAPIMTKGFSYNSKE